MSYHYTSEIRAAILQRDAEERANSDTMVVHEIISTPNGQKYGKEGHIPCDHVVEFRIWAVDTITVRSFDGRNWATHQKILRKDAQQYFSSRAGR